MRTALLLALLVLTPACAARRGKWSFPCSYHVYRSLDRERVARDWSRVTPSGGPQALAVMAVLLALPIAIDLAILPVTGVHDLCDGG